MIVKLLAFVLVAWVAWRGLSRLDRGTLRTLLRRCAWPVFAIALAVLALTGHLSWLPAVLAALLAGLRRLLPWIVRLWPVIAPLAGRRGRRRGGDATGRHDRDPDEATSVRGGGDRTMSREEALSLLGLEDDPDPDRERIVQAHRRLMQRLHPDKGGTDGLARRINEARDVLLGRHPPPGRQGPR